MQNVTCFKCDGAGHIEAFAGIADGVCFQCNGSGRLTIKEVAKFRGDLPEATRRRCEWILKSTPEAFANFTDKQIVAAREFAHHYVMNPAANALYGRTVIEAWRNQGGEERFQEYQVRWREYLDQQSY